MSYDISLVDPVSGKTLELEHPHQMRGGTYALGGMKELWLNVTYNYYKHYARTIDPEKGIRAIYGLTGQQSKPILSKAIQQLADDIDDDYWKPTEGNAKAALINLLTMAALRPDGVWKGD